VTNKTKIVNTAQKFLQKGAYDKAIRELQKLVEEDPRDVRTLLKIGDIYAKKGDKTEAIAIYRRVAESYSEQGFFLKAVAVYKQILKHDPQHFEVTLKLAELYEHLGLTQEAMAQYQLIATLHDQKGNAREWLAVLERMVELDPENVAARVRLAEGFSREQLIPKAVDQFAKAADLLKKQGRNADYVKVAERLVFHDQARFDVLKDLARIYLSQGDSKRAAAKLKLCFEQSPRDIETLTLLGQAFRDVGHAGKAIYVYHQLAKVHAESGARDEARLVHQTILELDPNDEDSRRALGMIPSAKTDVNPPSHQRSQDLRPARTQDLRPQRSQDLRSQDIPTSTVRPPPPQANKAAPAKKSQKTRDQIAKLLTETDVYVKYGLREKALEHLKRILELDADSLEAYLKMREIFLASRDHTRAAEAITNIVRIHETHGAHDEAEEARAQLAAINAPAGAHGGKAAHEQEEEIDVEIDVSAEFPAAERSRPQMHAGDATDDLVVYDGPPQGGQATDDLQYDPRAAEAGLQPWIEGSGSQVGEVDIVSSRDLPAPEEEGEHKADGWEDGSQSLLEAFVPEASQGVEVAVAREPSGSASMEVIENLSDQQLRDVAAERVPLSSFAPPAGPAQEEAFGLVSEEILREAITSQIEAPSLLDLGDEPISADPGGFRELSASEFSELSSSQLAPIPDEPAPIEDLLESLEGPDEPLSEPDGKDPNLDEDIESAEFLETQGLYDEAREAVLDVLKKRPFYTRAIELLDRVEVELGMRQPEAQRALSEEEEALLGLGGEGARPIAAEGGPSKPPPAAEAAPADEPMMSSEELEAARDLESAYAYREAGMLAEAIASFEKATNVPSRAAEALEMIGHCRAAQGDTYGAVDMFYKALERGAAPDRAPRLKYEIGIACENASDLENALAWYTAAYADDPSQPYLLERIQNLGGNPGAPGGASGQNGSYGAAADAQSSARQNQKKNKKNISYL
jgi:pilus assembly protein FimV